MSVDESATEKASYKNGLGFQSYFITNIFFSACPWISLSFIFLVLLLNSAHFCCFFKGDHWMAQLDQKMMPGRPTSYIQRDVGPVPPFVTFCLYLPNKTS